MHEVLFAWIVDADLEAAAGRGGAGLGPIAQAAAAGSYDRIVLIGSGAEAPAREYARWLSGHTRAETQVFHEKLDDPADFESIRVAVRRTVDAELARSGGDARPTFHLNPDAPAMAVVWIILAQAVYGAQLVRSSRDKGAAPAAIRTWLLFVGRPSNEETVRNLGVRGISGSGLE
jgi:hypothetical protein